MKKYDVLIVGGSHAGLSAGMAIGRMQRSALIVDEGKARNSVALHAHNIAGLDGQNPASIREDARLSLRPYKTIVFQEGSVTSIRRQEGGFEAQLNSGEIVLSRKVILAFGVRDTLPAIDGIKDSWGKSVFHCPFCHGHEFKDKKIGLVGNGSYLAHMVPMILNLTTEVILLPQEMLDLDQSVSKILSSKGIKAYTPAIKELVLKDDSLDAVILEDGTRVELSALLVAPIGQVGLNSLIGDQLGCIRDEEGFISTDSFAKTSINGVYAAGDITGRFQSVVQALASGQKAGAAAVMDLSHEDFYT